MVHSPLIGFNPIKSSFYLWLLTNFIGDAGWGVWLFFQSAGNLHFERSEVEWAAFLVSCGLVPSIIIVPFARSLSTYILPLPRLKRLLLTGLGVLAIWLLPVLVLACFMWARFNAGFSTSLPKLLVITSSHLGAAYLATIAIYRRWLFRPDTAASSIPNAQRF